LSRPPQPFTEGIEQLKAVERQQSTVMQQWTAAEKYLARAELRLQVEMKAVQELIGEECICEVKDHTFPNSLAQWKVTLKTSDGAIAIGLAFPMCYPRWPPHMFSLQHVPLAHRSVPVVFENGGINALILMGLSCWSPSVQVKDLLSKLCPIVANEKWETSQSINPKFSITSFCGDIGDSIKFSSPPDHPPHVRNNLGILSQMQDRASTREAKGLSSLPQSIMPKVSESSWSSSLGLSSAPAQRPQELKVIGFKSHDISLEGEFQAILEESAAMAAELGGAPNFLDRKVSLIGKVTRKEFKAYTGFEHVQLTILGFARLSEISEEVLSLNNGAAFFSNPGTMLLEKECGLTMHADRHGAIEAVKTGPDLMLTVFRMAQKAGKATDFFMKAFNRHHDPCLEGRFLLIQEFGQDLLAGGFHAEELQLQDSANRQNQEASDEGEKH
jgi:ubiquitin-protein ligase